jgi:hypothetical protein
VKCHSPAGTGSGQPNLAVSPDGRVYLSWIERLGEGRFSLRFATLEKEGWSTPRVIAEGSNWFVNWADFPSMVALPDGSLAAHWLVKNGAETYEYDVTISRSFDVYRDRSEAEKEIRDISVVRLKGDKWSAPRPVFQDGWELNGCPVNGPAVAAAGRRVVVAWFTGADKTSRVKVAFSNDAGETFGQPIAVDDGNPAGRVDVLLLNDGGAMVCWLEKSPDGGAVRVRRVKPDGQLDEAITVTPSGTARSNGFPQMARAGDALVFAWTGSRVLTATMPY